MTNGCDYLTTLPLFIALLLGRLVLLGRHGTLLLHTLTAREFSSNLLDLAVAVRSGVAVLGCGLHGVDAALLVGLAALLPCCVAGYAANDALGWMSDTSYKSGWKLEMAYLCCAFDVLGVATDEAGLLLSVVRHCVGGTCVCGSSVACLVNAKIL